MSMGIGAVARLYKCDNDTYIYKYSSYNYNLKQEILMNGVIYLDKTFFKEPYIREKIKRLPNGKKKIVNIKHYDSLDYIVTLIKEGLIVIESCSNAYYYSNDDNMYDMYALKLVYKMFNDYQESSIIKEDYEFYI